MSTRTLIHSSPLGALEIPGAAGVIEPGTPFTVDSAIADSLLQQADVFALAPTTKPATKGSDQ